MVSGVVGHNFFVIYRGGGGGGEKIFGETGGGGGRVGKILVNQMKMYPTSTAPSTPDNK